MNINRKDIDEVNAVLNLKVVPEDYENKVEKVLRDYRKNVSLKGFRPGKAPMGHVKKLYGKSILVEEVNKIISESLSGYFVENKIKVLGDPMPAEEGNDPIDWDVQKEFEFAFSIGLAPQFTVELSDKDKVPYYTIKIDKKLRDGYTENYTKRFGSYKEAEKVESGEELVKGSLKELAENGIVVEDSSMSLTVIKDEEIKKQFTGLKKGEKLEIDLKKAWPNDTELASILKIEKEKVADISDKFELEVKAIEAFTNAEINQDFYDMAFGKDEVKTKEEFKKKIDEEISVNLEKESEARFSVDVRDMLVKKLGLKLPEEFLNKWLVYANEGKFTKEQIDKDFDLFKTDLQWQLIREEIVKQQEIKVDEKEILDYSKEVTRMQFMQYGLANLPDEQLEHYAKEILEKDEEKQKLSSKLFEDKVVDYVRGVAKVEDKKISTEDFNKLYEANQA